MYLSVLVASVKPEISAAPMLDSAPHILSQRVFRMCICVQCTDLVHSNVILTLEGTILWRFNRNTSCCVSPSLFGPLEAQSICREHQKLKLVKPKDRQTYRNFWIGKVNVSTLPLLSQKFVLSKTKCTSFHLQKTQLSILKTKNLRYLSHLLLFVFRIM